MASSNDLDVGGLILQVLEEKGQLDSYDYSKETGREHQTVIGAIKSLQSVGNVSTSLQDGVQAAVWIVL